MQYWQFSISVVWCVPVPVHVSFSFFFVIGTLILLLIEMPFISVKVSLLLRIVNSTRGATFDTFYDLQIRFMEVCRENVKESLLILLNRDLQAFRFFSMLKAFIYIIQSILLSTIIWSKHYLLWFLFFCWLLYLGSLPMFKLPIG